MPKFSLYFNIRDINQVLHIDPNAKVVLIPFYGVAVPELVKLYTQLDEMIQMGFIRPSISPKRAIVLFKRMKDGAVRLHIAYHGSNKATIIVNIKFPR